jgi:hypothetical protein
MNFPWLEIHGFTTLFMCGVAWFVQVVHYPLMARVGSPQWTAYHRSHGARTTWVVLPTMTLEAISALLLAWVAPGADTWSGLALVGVLWLSTFCVQVPLHSRLARGFDTRTHARLVASSWIRTVAWSVRAVLAATCMSTWTP